MNRSLFILFVSVFLMALSACGTEESSGSDTTADDASSTEETEQGTDTESKETDAPETMTAEENENKDAKVGDTVTSEAGEQTMVSRTDDVGTFESGPISLTIEKVNGVSGTLKGEAAALMDKEEIEYIQVDMKTSNSSEDHITFYASQAVMTTNTGEQLEPDMLMSDHIDGEYLGQVNKEGTSFYFLKNSKAEDVESITLYYSAALNENFEDIGEEIEVDVNLNK
ncbi:hypothetical protein JF544_10985 [Halobacillus kuroshimensis]|uniref:DUF4352 domain-containing protein n=1 Tax=Halobacillus kuroshimensis TaxID=302481 RepID=A0ABS3DWS4_9BACI|nr:hypothetical protein [Halobacillus kuroshimensis]MBN8235776.1 hypothetical protein [Halobacillus kuroshimensis]